MNNRKSLYDVSSFYNKKAKLKASFKGMRYQVQQIEQEDETKELEAVVWPEPYCIEKTPEDEKEVKTFPYTEEGLDQAYEWICSNYESQKDRWDYALTHPYEGKHV